MAETAFIKRYEGSYIKLTQEHNTTLPKDHPAKNQIYWSFDSIDPYHPYHTSEIKSYLHLYQQYVENKQKLNSCTDLFTHRYELLFSNNNKLVHEMNKKLLISKDLEIQIQQLQQKSKQGLEDDITKIPLKPRLIYEGNKLPSLPQTETLEWRRLKTVEFKSKFCNEV